MPTAKAADLLDKVPNPDHGTTKADSREISAAPPRATAEAATTVFVETYVLDGRP